MTLIGLWFVLEMNEHAPGRGSRICVRVVRVVSVDKGFLCALEWSTRYKDGRRKGMNSYS